MACHIPLVVDSLDAANCTIAIVCKASINRFWVEQIGQMKEARLAVWPIGVEAVLHTMSDREQHQLILELEMIAQAPIQNLTQRSSLWVVKHPFRMKESLNTLP
jgi:hypothetical protein